MQDQTLIEIKGSRTRHGETDPAHVTESGEQPASPAEPSTPSSVASLTKEQQKAEINAKEEIAKAKAVR